MRAPAPNVCILEDDPIMGESLTDRLELEGFAVRLFRTAGQALAAARTSEPSAALLVDIRLPDMSGEEFYQRLGEQSPVIPPTIFMTGYGTIDQAVRLLKLGASDYLTKPVDASALVDKLRALCGTQSGDDPVTPLGVSASMRDIEHLLERVARHPETPVLITGESGAGKEEVARRLHSLEHPDRPFVALNCSALPEHLLETELFGHERGAFTGAERAHRGLFEQAEGGTLLLDEVGDMPLPMQAKLLRTIQERQVVRLGGERPIAVALRLVCATHENLEELVAQRRFREDLLYRIKVVEVSVPPLRGRPEDVPWLAERFLDEHRRRFPDRGKALSEEAIAALCEYRWPGNVRELRHVLERACIMNEAPTLRASDVFPGALPQGGSTTGRRLSARVADSERGHIIAALEENGWRIAATADCLGITRKTLWQKMRRLGISRPGG